MINVMIAALQQYLPNFGRPGLGAFGLALVIPALWFWSKLNQSMPHPDISLHKGIRSIGWPYRLCQTLLLAAILSFSIALAHPRKSFTERYEKLETRAFWVCLDRSSSMTSKVDDPKIAAAVAQQIKLWHERKKAARLSLPKALQVAEEEAEVVDMTGPTRFQLARYFSGKLMDSRPSGDRVGVTIFNDMADTKIIPSTDLKFVQELLYSQRIDFGGGTNFDGPTGPNQPKGAIQECIDGFALKDDENHELCPEATRIILLISDGEADIGQKRFNELLEQMQADPARPIRIYGLVIGNTNQMANEHVENLRRFTAAVNGQGWPNSVILATDSDAVNRALQFLDKTEKTSSVSVTKIDYTDASRPWLAAGYIFFILFGVACWPLRINN